MNRPQIPKRFLGAFKAGHRVATREFIDEELSYELLNKIIASNYTDEVSIKHLEYITRFNDEYHRDVCKKDDPQALHGKQIAEGMLDKHGKPMTLRKDCGDRNNARNRDIMSVKRSELDSFNDLTQEELTYGDDDKFIEFIQLRIDSSDD